MTADLGHLAAELRAKAAKQRDDAAELDNLAAQIEILSIAGTGRPAAPDPLIDTGKAAAIAHASSSTLYRIAKEHTIDGHRIGWQTETGRWIFSEPRLRKFLTKQAG